MNKIPIVHFMRTASLKYVHFRSKSIRHLDNIWQSFSKDTYIPYFYCCNNKYVKTLIDNYKIVLLVLTRQTDIVLFFKGKRPSI